MTLSELNRLIINELTEILGSREAAATARLLLEDGLGIDQTTLLTRGDRNVEPETESRFRDYIRRIKSGEPPQYVVGHARFMGLDLAVTRDTLIPRPETAELVDLVTDYAGGRSDLRILDAGTGTGCIAIALARALSFARITAVDISEAALKVSRQNARNLRVNIEFVCADILSEKFSGLDIVVSNPPYITDSERGSMERRVKDFEPASALFVSDNDPLKFYRAILQNCTSAAYFFEINPLFAADLQSLAQSMGYSSEILLDSFGRKRFAKITV